MAGGRQRAFDKEWALEQAMRVFWQKGYLGSSLMDLTQAMGINKPSMYAAFGNKEDLFIQATQNYLEHYASCHTKLLSLPGQTAQQRLKAFMLSTVKTQCGQEGPIGCYISLCVSEAASDELPAKAKEMIERIKYSGEEILEIFFSQALSKHELIHRSSAKSLAAYFITVLNGTAAMSRAGKTWHELEATIDLSLTTLIQEN